jgi:hypothetical protein
MVSPARVPSPTIRVEEGAPRYHPSQRYGWGARHHSRGCETRGPIHL